MFKAKYTVLIYLNILNSHVSVLKNFLSVPGSGWVKKYVVGKESGIPYLSTVGILAGWQQKFTASFRLNLDFMKIC